MARIIEDSEDEDELTLSSCPGRSQRLSEQRNGSQCSFSTHALTDLAAISTPPDPQSRQTVATDSTMSLFVPYALEPVVQTGNHDCIGPFSMLNASIRRSKTDYAVKTPMSSSEKPERRKTISVKEQGKLFNPVRTLSAMDQIMQPPSTDVSSDCSFGNQTVALQSHNGLQQAETSLTLTRGPHIEPLEHKSLDPFPNTADTVPFNTAENMRLIDELNGIDTAHPTYALHINDGGMSSLPWSTFLKTPSEADNFTSSALHPAETENLAAAATVLNQGEMDVQQPPNACYIDYGLDLNEAPVVSSLESPTSLSLFDEAGSERALEKTSSVDGKNPNTDSSTYWKEAETRKADIPFALANPSLVSDLHSDDIAIGLPKEQYKPRPSRSRSVRIDEGPIDFSVRPEVTAKKRKARETQFTDGSAELVSLPAVQSRTSHSKRTRSAATGHAKSDMLANTSEGNRKSKRRRTDGGMPPDKPDPALVSVVTGMGFSPTQSLKALAVHDNNVEHAIEYLLKEGPTGSIPLNDQTQAVVINPSPPNTLERAEYEVLRDPALTELEQKITQNDTQIRRDIDKATDEAENPMPLPVSGVGDDAAVGYAQEPKAIEKPATKAKVGRPPKGSKKRRLKTMPAKLYKSDDEESEVEVVKVVEKPKEKKRGRGRPKRSEKAPEEHIPEDDTPTHGHTHDVQPSALENAAASEDTSFSAEALATSEVHDTESLEQPQPRVNGKDNLTAKVHVPATFQDVDGLDKENNEPTAGFPMQTPVKDKPTKPVSPHSALKNSRVAFRVGLSRKRKIPSLLKVIRK